MEKVPPLTSKAENPLTIFGCCYRPSINTPSKNCKCKWLRGKIIYPNEEEF